MRLPDVLALTRAYASNLPCAKVTIVLLLFLIYFDFIVRFWQGCVFASDGTTWSTFRSLCTTHIWFVWSRISFVDARCKFLFYRIFIYLSSHKLCFVKQNQPIEILFAMRAVFFSWLACLPPAHQDRLAFESVWHRLHDTLDDVHESDRLFNIFPDQWLNEVAKQHQ